MADTDTDTARRLAEIRARAGAATPGEWVMRAMESAFPERYQVHAPAADNINVVQSGIGVSNGAFVAHARDDIPYLLDLVAARDRELAELGGMLADLCEDSRAAATAVRYRRALERVCEIYHAPVGSPGDIYRVATYALEGESNGT